MNSDLEYIDKEICALQTKKFELRQEAARAAREEVQKLHWIKDCTFNWNTGPYFGYGGSAYKIWINNVPKIIFEAFEDSSDIKLNPYVYLSCYPNYGTASICCDPRVVTKQYHLHSDSLDWIVAFAREHSMKFQVSEQQKIIYKLLIENS